MNLNDYMKACRERVEPILTQSLALPDAVAPRLIEAMRYSVLNGGKRLRPMLVYASCEQVMGRLSFADPAAAAIELIHAYSLIHDDLPAMDDDDLRRGQPTCHRAFDEATAILAGDALQSLAFALLTDPTRLPQCKTPAYLRLQMVTELARAAGEQGMVAGQALDLAGVGQTLDLAALEQMHRHKTGAMIQAAVRLGLLAGGCQDRQLFEQLDRYSDAIGLAFQVQDDILDVISDTATLGKQQGADAAHAKPTYVSLLGLDGARAHLDRLYQEALASLAERGERAEPLRQLARYIVSRDH